MSGISRVYLGCRKMTPFSQRPQDIFSEKCLHKELFKPGLFVMPIFCLSEQFDLAALFDVVFVDVPHECRQ